MPLPLIIIGVVGASVVLIDGRRRARRKLLSHDPNRRRQPPTAERAVPPRAAATAAQGDSPAQQALSAPDRMLAMSAGATVTALGAYAFFPPLAIVSVGLSSYAAWPVFADALAGLRHEHRIKASAVDAIFIAGALAGGYYTAMALANVVYYLGRKLLQKTEHSARNRLDNLFGASPATVWLQIDGVEIEVAFDQVRPGQVTVLRAGQTVPIDGTVIDGAALADQRMLTGESQPVEKAPGDRVLAASLLVAGRVVVRIEQAGADTVAAGVAEILRNTADFRSSVELGVTRLADTLAVPTLALGATTLWLANPLSALAVTGCNFTEVLRIVTPLNTLSYLSRAAHGQILIKDGRSLELLAEIDTVVFDKTGTLTGEQPELAAVHAEAPWSADRALAIAAALEARQQHPLARAIVTAARQRGLELPRLDAAGYHVGYGIEACCDGLAVRCGSARFMQAAGIAIPAQLAVVRQRCERDGRGLLFLAVGDALAAAFELRTPARPEAAALVRTLQAAGMRVAMISGDHPAPTRALAAELGIDEWFAETLPADKAAHVRRLREAGRKVCFVGDGINDTVAMREAFVSISVKGATTAATDTAGIVLLRDGLGQIPELLALSRAYRRNLATSCALALVPGVAGLAGILLFGVGVPGMLLLYGTAMMAGTANAAMPLVRDGRGRNPPGRARSMVAVPPTATPAPPPVQTLPTTPGVPR